jgi:membrane protein
VGRPREFAHELATALQRDSPFDHAAQLAYFTMLAIFPGAMFLLTVIGYLPLHGLDAAVGHSLHAVLPGDVAVLVETILGEIVGRQRGWLLLSTLLFAAYCGADVAAGLTTSLNRAYRVPETRSFLQLRARTWGVTLVAGIEILIVLAAMLIGPEVVQALMRFLDIHASIDRVWAALRWPLALAAMMLVTATVYRVLPNVRQRRRAVIPGSIVAVLAWLALSLGFRAWVTHFPTQAKSYGALGTVVVLLIWLYWSSLMIILGGEVNAILDRTRGMRHEVMPGARREGQPAPQPA